MSQSDPTASGQSAKGLTLAARLRFAAALLALAGGTAAIVIAVVLVRNTLS